MAGLELRSITHRFDGVVVLDDIDLAVAPGELVCLLGPSGCGKTTLLRLAAGLEQVQEGEVEIGGQVVARGGDSRQMPPEKRGVGLMFQDYALFPHLNVFDNVRFGIRNRDWGRLSWVTEALRDVGLADFAERFPHTLSGGQQQRIALLRALAPSPRVILLDEPFSGLDENLRKQVRTETLKILDEVQIAAMMVTHDPEEAMFLADRIVIMDSGRIIQAAAPVVVYRCPAEPFVARMLGPTNEFEAVVVDGRAVTPIGDVDAGSMRDGEKVLVMVRAEAMSLASQTVSVESGTLHHHEVHGQVVRARPLGARTHLEVRVLGGGADRDRSSAPLTGALLPGTGCEAASPVMLAEIPGVHMLEAGSHVDLSVDSSLVHVFPVPAAA